MSRRVIAVTGGIGSGKSAVCEVLKNLGYAVVDADACAHEALTLPSVVSGLKALLGENCYLSNGTLDKDFVRTAIFRDSTLRSRMEKIVHPEVQRISAERIAAGATAGKDSWVFYEFALLFETGRHDDFDAVLLVTAAESVRVSRVAASRAIPAEQVRAIVAAQTTDAARRAGSHVVIDNSGTLEELARSVSKALTQLAARFSQSGF